MFKKIIIKTIRVYQAVTPLFLGKNCRFWPSCSEYFCQAVEKYGVLKGGQKGVRRVLKCYPWNQGGVDLP